MEAPKSQQPSFLVNEEIALRIQDRTTPELVFGMVSPIGAGASTTARIFESILKNEYGYETATIKISDIIKSSLRFVQDKLNDEFGNPAIPTAPAAKIIYLQSAGNHLRRKFSTDYLSKKAVERIALDRREQQGFIDEQNAIAKPRRKAHFIDSLKHPDEVAVLRKVYGNSFILIGVFSPLYTKRDRLTAKGIVERTDQIRLIERDRNESTAHGQKVSSAFYHSDFFIRNDSTTENIENKARRILEILFGIGTRSPTVEESAMQNAFAAAAKSACLSRQVGAAIYSASNELLGVGWNDPPMFGGSVYQEGCKTDCRCFKWENQIGDERLVNECRSDFYKRRFLRTIESNLKNAGLGLSDQNIGAILGAIREEIVSNLTEFSRSMHAEMEAIISVARMGKAGLIGSTLYSTTFPCHNCARHIVGAGIRRVYYVEPYPKSLALDLHSDSISEREDDSNSKVVFFQYEGISPNAHLKFFANGRERKGKSDGKFIVHERLKVNPIITTALDGFSTFERLVVKELTDAEPNQ